MDESRSLVAVLERLGLSSGEVTVYLALLELGSAPAGRIIEHADVQSSLVHATLGRLSTKGLVSSVLEGKRHVYAAADPSRLLAIVAEREASLREVMPELQQRMHLAGKKPVLVAYQGQKGIRQLYTDLLDEDGREHLTIGSPAESLMMGDAWWLAIHNKRAERGIRAKLLFNQSLAPWKSEVRIRLAEVRYLEQGFEPLTEFIIRGSAVATIVWSPTPYGTVVRDEAVAKSYAAWFAKLWITAGKQAL